jgi:50S ribosomal protein L16 3-hydroxylase
VFFARPPRPLTPQAFAAALARRGLHLDVRTQLLYDNSRIFINGAAIGRTRTAAQLIERLANARGIGAGDARGRAAVKLLYQWYCDGYLHLD